MLFQNNKMNDSINVSVIIPAYNVEKYLHECIDSLLAQSLKSIEIIIVDDGSTDQTKKIILEYQRIDTRIKLIQQINQGAGAARNSGMIQAKGKYIAFLDADDFFEPNFLRSVYTAAENNNAQIVLYDYYIYNDLNGKKKKIKTRDCPSGVFSSRDLGNKLFQIGQMIPWNKLYLRSFLSENNLQFQTIKKSNDVFFSICSLSLAHRIIFVNKCFVNYRIGNPTSLQGKVNIHTECGIISRKAAKQELIKRHLFTNPIKESFYECCKELRFYIIRITDSDTLYKYYLLLKENLIPDLFDSKHDFEDEKILSAVFCCESYEDFLFQLCKISRKQQNSNSVSKDCLEYRLGCSILRFPRRLRHGMERFFNVHRD